MSAFLFRRRVRSPAAVASYMLIGKHGGFHVALDWIGNRHRHWRGCPDRAGILRWMEEASRLKVGSKATHLPTQSMLPIRQFFFRGAKPGDTMSNNETLVTLTADIVSAHVRCSSAIS